MTRPNDKDQFRIVPLPVFPPTADDAEDAAKQALANRFSPNELLGGFLAGPENRMAELAMRLVNEGVPVFDRNVGDAPLTPVLDANRESSRADVEFLMSAATSPNPPEILRGGFDVLFDQNRFNSLAARSGGPSIVGYGVFEETAFLSPLVFYGPSGSGKSRVVEGICQRRRLLEPRKTLYYLSANDFSRALNDAIRRDQTQLFRDLFGRASVVAIENADVLAGKEAAQLEFLPMLDAAIKARKLVILTFSQLPSAIPGLLPDLVARTSSGLLVPMRLPSRETREFAIKLIAENLGLKFDPDALELCVDRASTTVGGLCASLVQIAREFSLFHTPTTFDNLQEYFDRRNPVQTWTVERILKTVAKYFSVSVVEMRSKKRFKTLVLARKYVAYLSRALTNATLQQIGDQFSSRDHSTIVHAVHEVEEGLRDDEQTRRDMRALIKALNAESKFPRALLEGGSGKNVDARQD